MPEDHAHQTRRPMVLSRRAFLLALGLGTSSALAAGCGLSSPAPAGAAPVTVPVKRQTAPDDSTEIELTAQEVPWELAPGKSVSALTFDGRVPGPELRVREGQRLRVTLTNQLTTPTTIHWHGVDVPNAMDGVPDLTQPAVQPGTSFVYEFDAWPAGTRWFHTHFASTEQLDRVLYAPLIIEPATPESDPPAREYTLVLSSWLTGQSPPVPDPSSSAIMGSGGMMGPGGMMQPGSGRGMGSMMGSATEPAYDTFTVNGKAYPATAPLLVGEGERVRLRLINASGSRTHLLHLEGHRLRVTHTDGNALQAPVEVDVIPIAPAERYDVEFAANRPGIWSLHDLAPGQTEAGLRVPIIYNGYETQSEGPLRTSVSGLQLWSYSLGRGVDRRPPPSGATRDFPLTLSGGMLGSDAWTINGKVYPSTDPLWVGSGDLVRLHLVNMSMQAHPMHLHGCSFRLFAIGGRTLPAPLIKDVVDLQPMERADLDFVADNPGDWMFHCHKPMHMDGGMATLIRYRLVGTG